MTTPNNNPSLPWANAIGHLAIVVDDVARAQWFFGEVCEFPYTLFRETQVMVFVGSGILVAKLSKDAVDTERQKGEFGRQVLDHYGFQANDAAQVDAFYQRIVGFGLSIVKAPYNRADGRAFYFRDPFGNLVEYLWYQETT